MSCHPTRSAAHRAAVNRARKFRGNVYAVLWSRRGYEVQRDHLAGLEANEDGAYLMVPAHPGRDVDAAFYCDPATGQVFGA